MLHDVHVTSAPSAVSVSISTAVSIVMWRQPATRAPLSGFVAPYSSRSAIRPGISFSAMRIFLRPSSARVLSLILNAGNSVRVSIVGLQLVAGGLLSNGELQQRALRARKRVRHDHVERGVVEECAELRRLEAEPHVSLLAHRLVVVRQVV